MIVVRSVGRLKLVLLLYLLLEHDLLHVVLLLLLSHVLRLNQLLHGLSLQESTIAVLLKRCRDLGWRATTRALNLAHFWRSHHGRADFLISCDLVALDHLVIHALDDFGRSFHRG